MATTLVTKLKAAVSNANLKKIGEGEIALYITSTKDYIEINNSQFSNLYFTADVDLNITTSGAYFTDVETRTQNLGTQITAHASSTSNRLSIKGTSASWVVLKVSNYYACGCGAANVTFNGLNALKYSVATFAGPFAPSSSLAELGKISRIKDISRVTVASDWNFHFAGDIADIGSLNLRNADFTAEALVVGNIEDFAAKICKNFPTRTDSVNCGCTGTNVKINGAKLSNRVYIKLNGDGTCKITTDTAYTTVLASYNGSAWTYM